MTPRIITDTTVTVHLDGDILVANSSHPAFQAIREAAQAQDWDALRNLIDVGKAIEVWSDGEFQIVDNTVTYNGERVPEALERRITGFLDEGAPFNHLLAFYRNLVQNPSRRSVQQLYSFLEHENIPIGEDGCFYAYKSVRRSPGREDDWGSWHLAPGGKAVPNPIGATISMPRNKVDDDPTRGCSYGYHVGSLAYASSFGGTPGTSARLLIVRVSPANVVSVPHDCNFQKVRTSEYTVVQEYAGPLPDVYWTPSMGNDDGVFPDDDDDVATGQAVRALQADVDDCEDQLGRLQTALDAAEDACAGTTVINGLCNAISEVESELSRLEEELAEYEDDLFEY